MSICSLDSLVLSVGEQVNDINYEATLSLFVIFFLSISPIHAQSKIDYRATSVNSCTTHVPCNQFWQNNVYLYTMRHVA